MNKNEILKMLEELGDEKRRKMNIKRGSGENTYGVLMGELRKIVKKIGKNHDLASELWETGNVEAQWIASMIFDVSQLSLDEIRAMASPLRYNDIIDKFMNETVSNHKDINILAEEWSSSKEDHLGRAGWDLIVHKISSEKLEDEELEKYLKIIEKELQTTTPGKQWAMNYALCQIGISYPEYTERCIKIGETLGVYKDLKVSKGCTSAYAPNWINAVVKKRKK